MSCGDESLLRLISLTAQVMRGYADHRLKKYDLTVEQLQVLKHMTVDHGQTQKELSSAAGKSAANLTRILDRLENKKRIVRRQSPDDRRATLVQLTGEGAELKEDVLRLFDALGESLVSEIDEEKQQVALEVLRTIKVRIENSSELQGEGDR